MASTRERDVYDDDVDYLCERLSATSGYELSDALHATWVSPDDTVGGSLFLFLNDSGGNRGTDDCGCPTQVKSNKYKAQSAEVTDFVRSLDLIPAASREIAHRRGSELRATLEAFAECQRAADRAHPGRYETVKGFVAGERIERPAYA